MKIRLPFLFAALILFALQVLLVQCGLNWFIFLPFFRMEMGYFHVFGLLTLLKIIAINGKKSETESWTDKELLNGIVINFLGLFFFGAVLCFAKVML